MLRSMTGYGKSSAAINGKNFTVEIRSLNSKYFDLNLKAPLMLREKEIALRNKLSEKIMRGKVETLIETPFGEQKQFAINRNAFKQYFSELESLRNELSVPSGNLFEAILKIPDVLAAPNESLDEEGFLLLEKAIESAFSLFDKYRLTEGEQLANDITMRVKNISDAVSEISALDIKRREQLITRLTERVKELKESTDLDPSRLEQEILFYAERLDITEEIVRLNSHCSYFHEVVADKEISKGKKLSFISQEIGREINTIGSKANDADMQRWVMSMKEELEKIKEQLNNVL